MGGIIGTALMLLETSGCGAVLDIDAIPRPPDEPLDKWLLSFPSYGFLLSVPPAQLPQIQPLFHAEGLVCEAIGQVTAGHELGLRSRGESTVFWDFAKDALTGFGDRAAAGS